MVSCKVVEVGVRSTLSAACLGDKRLSQPARMQVVQSDVSRTPQDIAQPPIERAGFVLKQRT